MLEIPETTVISKQLNDTVKGKRIKGAVAATSPHKFAWYFGDPAVYGELLSGRVIEYAAPYGARIEITAEGAALNIAEGAVLRYYEAGEKLPAKHQLLVTLEDDSSLVGTVAMYGGLFAFPIGAMDDEIYYKAAKEAVSPLSEAFDLDFYMALFNERASKMSAKAFLATEQRIPGLGNGVLQDILLNARIHPKRKMNTLSDEQQRGLFNSIKSTLAEMTEGGGRDTERDLFGNFGGYVTKLSKRTAQSFCVYCGGAIKKEAYLGGSIYYCEQCQQM